MKRLAALIGATVIALMASACNQPVDTRNADVQALKDNEAQWNLDWAARDADKVAAHYAEDSVLIAPGSPATSGKAAIAGALRQMMADPAISLKFQASKVDVSKSGDVGYTQGSYLLTVTDSQTKQVINDHGSYVTVYRKQPDGTWKAVSDIASSEVAPPAPVAPQAKKH